MVTEKQKKAFLELFPLLVRINLSFSGKSGNEICVECDKTAETISRYGSGQRHPSLLDGFIYLVEEGFDLKKIEQYYKGARLDFFDIQQRIIPNANKQDNPYILVAPFFSAKKQEWHLSHARFILPVLEQNQKMLLRYERFKKADFVLIYKRDDAKVARMYRIIHQENQAIMYRSDEALADKNNLYPNAKDHRCYLDFPIDTKKYYEVWDWDWYKIFDKKDFGIGVPKMFFLSEFFDDVQLGKHLKYGSLDADDAALRLVAADDGE